MPGIHSSRCYGPQETLQHRPALEWCGTIRPGFRNLTCGSICGVQPLPLWMPQLLSLLCSSLPSIPHHDKPAASTPRGTAECIGWPPQQNLDGADGSLSQAARAIQILPVGHLQLRKCASKFQTLCHQSEGAPHHSLKCCFLHGLIGSIERNLNSNHYNGI